MSKPAPLLKWKRAARTETEVSFWTVWGSKCGNYRVVFTRSKHGLPDSYVAERLERMPDGRVMDAILGRTKKKTTAIAACEAEERKRRRLAKKGKA